MQITATVISCLRMAKPTLTSLKAGEAEAVGHQELRPAAGEGLVVWFPGKNDGVMCSEDGRTLSLVQMQCLLTQVQEATRSIMLVEACVCDKTLLATRQQQHKGQQIYTVLFQWCVLWQ